MRHVGSQLAEEEPYLNGNGRPSLNQGLLKCDMAGTVLAAASDRLWRFADAPYTRQYVVLGVPIEIALNAPALADIADHTFGHWPKPETGEDPPIRLRVFLHDPPEP